MPFLQELVNKLLHLHFRDCKTKGLGHQWGGEYWGPGREGGCPVTSPFPPVNGDALQLMAEFLRIFVLGEPRAPTTPERWECLVFLFLFFSSKLRFFSATAKSKPCS